MNQDLVKAIQSKKLDCVFISPHCDDAVLSCGTLLSQLSGKTNLTVVNVFTKAHKKPYTLSAQQFLKTSNHFSDANALYKERVLEDKKALTTLGIKIVNLDLEDALFRRKKQSSLLGKIIPEIDHLYPTYRWHVIKKIASKDYAMQDLKKVLKQFKTKNTLIFAPYGIGNHVDHKITRMVCEDIFENLILYSDFPYNSDTHEYETPKKNEEAYILNPNSDKKNRLIAMYKTQFAGLFPDGKIPDHKEVYFIKKDL
ncbi:MAG TPA: PIG-L family deacetylase [Methylomirabilota bacterium]|nr:PIG-L family deacetylase [Methylomirabilota bacterium]